MGAKGTLLLRCQLCSAALPRRVSALETSPVRTRCVTVSLCQSSPKCTVCMYESSLYRVTPSCHHDLLCEVELLSHKCFFFFFFFLMRFLLSDMASESLLRFGIYMFLILTEKSRTFVIVLRAATNSSFPARIQTNILKLSWFV